MTTREEAIEIAIGATRDYQCQDSRRTWATEEEFVKRRWREYEREHMAAVVDALRESGLLNDQRYEQVGCRWIERTKIDGTTMYVGAGPAWHYLESMMGDGTGANPDLVVEPLFRRVDVPGETP